MSIRLNMIEVSGLVKWHGSTEVLKGLSLNVGRGEVATLIGPSGSGKSTFLRCLNGLEAFQGGTIAVDGLRLGAGDRPVERSRTLRQVCLRLGMVFQSFNLFPHRTVLQNVIEGPVWVLGLHRDQAEDRARRLLDRVGMVDRLHALPRELSGGQQQRVAIARALVNRPQILLADEPTGNLDSRTSVEIMEILQQLNEEQGLTVVLVTHESDIAQYALRALEFRDGRIRRDRIIANRLSAREVLPTLPTPDSDPDDDAEVVSEGQAEL
jgi:ABC-type polar amino acid transport system ATPase subunit